MRSRTATRISSHLGSASAASRTSAASDPSTAQATNSPSSKKYSISDVERCDAECPCARRRPFEIARRDGRVSARPSRVVHVGWRRDDVPRAGDDVLQFLDGRRIMTARGVAIGEAALIAVAQERFVERVVTPAEPERVDVPLEPEVLEDVRVRTHRQPPEAERRIALLEVRQSLGVERPSSGGHGDGERHEPGCRDVVPTHRGRTSSEPRVASRRQVPRAAPAASGGPGSRRRRPPFGPP